MKKVSILCSINLLCGLVLGACSKRFTLSLWLFVFSFSTIVTGNDEVPSAFVLKNRPIFFSIFLNSGVNSPADFLSTELAVDAYDFLRVGSQLGLGALGTTTTGYADILWVTPSKFIRQSLFVRYGYGISLLHTLNKDTFSTQKWKIGRHFLLMGIDIIVNNYLHGYAGVGITYSYPNDRHSNISNKRAYNDRLWYPLLTVGIGLSDHHYLEPRILNE